MQNLKDHSSTKIEDFDTYWLRSGGRKILKVFVFWDETTVSLGADSSFGFVAESRPAARYPSGLHGVMTYTEHTGYMLRAKAAGTL